MSKRLPRLFLILILGALVILILWVFLTKPSTPDNIPGNPPQITVLPSENVIQSPENNSTQPMAATESLTLEQPVLTIPLAGPIAESRSEISGMAWFGDTLLLLPQYPSRFGSGDGVVFGLEKRDILAYINGNITSPLNPQEIQFSAPGISQLDGFQGYEAIAVDGDRVYITIEANPGNMLGYIITGRVSSNATNIILDPATLEEIQPPVQIENMAYEAVLVMPDQVIAFFESNGSSFTPSPIAQKFSHNGDLIGTLPMTTLEYRLTDVTPPDDLGRFWGINYFYPGDTKLNPENDDLVDKYGEGLTHSQYTIVERLVQFQYSEDGITLVSSPPIQLQLLGENQARNWEAIARLDDRGFLLATDKYPYTILGFVDLP